ncbi:MAG: hypothetical protein NVS2B12_24490 [Ktedonobacteraceae bacterium]
MSERHSSLRFRLRWFLRIIFVLLFLAAILLSIDLVRQQLLPPFPPHHTYASFVQRSGSSLLLNGKKFRFSGTNMYWLGLLETKDGTVYPSRFEVEDALATARAMGATVVRSHTLGISVGCALCLETDHGTFNQAAFRHVDFAIQAAARYGMRLIIPLVDNWRYYHGGKHTFTDWLGLPDEDMFYSDAEAITDFQHYTSTLLNHINTYTGIAYKDDPTILAWELGNELRAPLGWEETMAIYLKGIDPHHLIASGSYNWQARKALFAGELDLPFVDIYSGHYYPPSSAELRAQAALTQAAQKVFIAEEYDWNTNDGASLSSFLTAIEQSAIAGDLYWSLFPHDDMYGFVRQDEHFTLHYPGNTLDIQARVRLLRAHAYALRGFPMPADDLPATPRITSIQQNKIFWRGAANAYTYTIERSTSGPAGPWIVLCERCATDNDPPWADTTQPDSGPLYYRMKASAWSGIYGAYSDVYKMLN